eukprot:GHVN01012702.1.p1 GENE.GHVN01012702.1~~GHVN01012702.1.p1  ORF type:complete len:1220 (+),score=250.88 GHVN01012702.1:149-3808(+)
MAEAPTLDLNTYITIINGFSADQAPIRNEAEAAFNQLKANHPNDLAKCVLQVMAEHPDAVTRQAASLNLRTCLREFLREPLEVVEPPSPQSAPEASGEDVFWGRLSPETQKAICGQLIRQLSNEDARQVRRISCDTASELGSVLLAKNQWPELLPALMTLLSSKEPKHQSSGLRTMAGLEATTHDAVVNTPDKVRHLIDELSQSQDPFVRGDVLLLVSTIIDTEAKSTWKSVIPKDIILHVTRSIEVLAGSYPDLALAYIETLVEIADRQAIFFRSHFDSFSKTLLSLIRDKAADEETRRLGVELLLSICEARPAMCSKTEGFISAFIAALMELMLDIDDDAQWLDRLTDVEGDEEDNNYDVGEKGMDRIAAAIEGEVVMPPLFAQVRQYLQHSEWQYKLVGIMAVSQTVEYLPEDGRDDTLEEITKMLLMQLRAEHHRVRYAACQAIGQTALDHKPYFQRAFYQDVLPALVNALDDPVGRVSSHAAAALVNFAEEVNKVELRGYTDAIMEKMLPRLDFATPRLIREQCVTTVAVVAGVMEEQFLQHYDVVVPLMKELTDKCVSKEERNCRGRAIECLSIIGLSVGYEAFADDGNHVIQAILSLRKAGFEADNTVKEYAHEALRRLCRTFKTNFLVYVPVLLPQISASVSTPLREPPTDDADDDMESQVICDDGVMRGLRSFEIEDIEESMLILQTMLEVLGPSYEPFIADTFKLLLPLIEFPLSDAVRRTSLTSIALCIESQRTLANNGVALITANSRPVPAGQAVTTPTAAVLAADTHPWTPPVTVPIPEVDLVKEQIVSQLLSSTIGAVLTAIDNEKDDEIMNVLMGGLAVCIQVAGPNTLNVEQIGFVCKKVFESLMDECDSKRQAIVEEQEKEKALDKSPPDFDEDELDELELDAQMQQALRCTMLEIVAAIMEHHPDGFMEPKGGIEMCVEYITEHIQPTASSDDKTIALFIADDMISQLGAKCIPKWPLFITRLVECVLDEAVPVRQAAAFGVNVASRRPEFAGLAFGAAEKLAMILKDGGERNSKKPENQSMIDNVIAALMNLVHNHAAAINAQANGPGAPVVLTEADAVAAMAQGHAHELMKLVMDCLPLKADAAEGRKVHKDLMDMVVNKNIAVVGEELKNLPRIIYVFSAIYETDMSTMVLDARIQLLLSQIGKDKAALLASQGGFTKKQIRNLQRVFRAIEAEEAGGKQAKSKAEQLACAQARSPKG